MAKDFDDDFTFKKSDRYRPEINAKKLEFFESKILEAIDNFSCLLPQIKKFLFSKYDVLMSETIDDVLEAMEGNQVIRKVDNGALTGYFRSDSVPLKFWNIGNNQVGVLCADEKLKEENDMDKKFGIPTVELNEADVEKYSAEAEGATLGEVHRNIAAKLGIGFSTFGAKMQKNPNLKAAYDRGRVKFFQNLGNDKVNTETVETESDTVIQTEEVETDSVSIKSETHSGAVADAEKKILNAIQAGNHAILDILRVSKTHHTYVPAIQNLLRDKFIYKYYQDDTTCYGLVELEKLPADTTPLETESEVELEIPEAEKEIPQDSFIFESLPEEDVEPETDQFPLKKDSFVVGELLTSVPSDVIDFGTAGTLELNLNVNLFQTDKRSREFLMGLIERVQDFRDGI